MDTRLFTLAIMPKVDHIHKDSLISIGEACPASSNTSPSRLCLARVYRARLKSSLDANGMLVSLVYKNRYIRYRYSRHVKSAYIIH